MPDTFDTRLKTLLEAFKAHEDLRASKADIPALARSRHELYRAGMAAHQFNR